MKSKLYELEIAGKKLIAEFSDLADQANGSVILKCDDTIVLAAAVMSKKPQPSLGFFNLTVEYLERYYASGLILGGQYNKREGRPSDEAILSARIIDRTIRPLFPQHLKHAIQVVTTVLSVGKADPGVLAINAASLALAVSDIPWAGPVGAVHIGRPKGEKGFHYDAYVPHNGETGYDLDLTVCGHKGKVCMIESLAFELGESDMGEAFDTAMAHITTIEEWQKNIVAELGKPKMEALAPALDPKVKTLFDEKVSPILEEKLFGGKSAVTELENMWSDILDQEFPKSNDVRENEALDAIRTIGRDYLTHMMDEMLHTVALTKKKRADGRGLDDVRALVAKAGGFSPLLHGTGIFYRGETHVFSALTLGGPGDVNVLEGMEVRGNKRFMHHYNFPSYSVGETGRFGGINRREMGHGFLAEKALTPVIPAKELFPYTIRLVSECLASNGSTSQASVCASTLALMDGGVPIKSPVAGISIGLMVDEHNDSNYVLLTDIQGLEDHHGDMDFKVAGTRTGITAMQLDIKVAGVTVAALKEALVKAKNAREKIIDVIEAEIAKPRADISPLAPKILIVKIMPDQIGLVIGGGGKTVNAIREATGTEIDIEDDGSVFITGKGDGAERAKKMIEELTHEFKVGEEYDGEVVKILEVGAIVKLSEHNDGMVHVSEIAPFRVMKVDDVLKLGTKVPVKVISVDKEKGRIGLSIKQRDPNFIKNPYPPRPTTETKL